MRSLYPATFVFGATMFLAAATAQPPAPQQPMARPGPRGGSAMLLRSEGVQKELKLTEEQLDRLELLAIKTQRKYQKEFEKLRDIEGKERAEKTQE